MKKIIITLSLIFGNIFVFGNNNHSIVEKGDYYNNNSQYARFWSEVTLTCKKMDSKKSSMIRTKYHGTDDPDYFGSRSLDESQGITYLLYFKECIFYQAPDEYDSAGEEKLYNVGVKIYSEWENKIKEKNINLYDVKNFLSISGRGVIGEIEAKKYLLGNKKLLLDNNIKDLHEEEIHKYELQGKTTILLADEEKLIAFITLADVVRNESLELIKKLKKENIKTYMLTGDNERTARVIAEKLGIDDVIAEVSPEDKYKKVKELQEQGKKVAMIGDGINDSPALAQADVGMAIGSGTDIAIESADIVLMGKDIEVILTAIRLSRATIKNIKENLFWAFFYNSCGIPIAGGLLYLFTGHLLNPMIAGLAMGMSSVSVVSNALRLKRFK